MGSSGTNNGKDVIYIDVDDEITGVIDKVRGSGQKIVALVLPKRATVLQSIVNMKLLKRSSDEAKKHIVLITAEAGLLPLAGVAGLHVAKTLQSKPEVPDAPAKMDDTPENVSEPVGSLDDEADVAAAEPALDKAQTVGELATAAADDETIELDDEDPDQAAGSTLTPAGAASTKGKNKKFKIPNFNKFRLLLILGGVGIVLLIIGIVFALKVLPKASVIIKTDSTAINTNIPMTLKTAAETALDPATGVIPATLQQTQKTQTQDVPATGQQNNGVKATGNVTLSLTDCSKDQVTVPAGSGVTSGGKTFITQQSATMNSVKVGGVCKNSTHLSDSTATVGVVAQTGGAQYNIAPSTFTVSGCSGGCSGVTGASSAAMSGGTDDIIKIVTQADIDGAKQKISAQDATPIHQDLTNGLIAKGLYAIDETFKTGDPAVTTSVNAGDKADNVTVTQVTTYTMLGVKQADIQSLAANAAKKSINPAKQSILSYGLDNAKFALQSLDADNGATVTVETTVVAGPQLNVATIKKQVAGKKAGNASEIIKANPGVKDVKVTYSPFWVGSIPTNTAKITVTIEKPKVTTDAKPATP
jgi:hypothetical protein